MKIDEFDIFKDNITTLKELSLDKHDKAKCEYMTESALNAVNFDKVKRYYYSNLFVHDKSKIHIEPKSNDALFDLGKGKLVFIEFKNGHIDNRTQYDLQKKIYDSILIYLDITSTTIKELRENVDYILVYNGDKNDVKNKVQKSDSYEIFTSITNKLAKERIVYFGIKAFEKYCFRKVYTLTKDEFEIYLKDISQ